MGLHQRNATEEHLPAEHPNATYIDDICRLSNDAASYPPCKRDQPLLLLLGQLCQQTASCCQSYLIMDDLCERMVPEPVRSSRKWLAQ
jgi:hypothetical protein